VAVTGSEKKLEEKKPRSEKEIREELEKVKKRVEELEKELAALIPAEDVKPRNIPDDSFKLGEAYYFYYGNLGAAVKVLEIVDEKSAIVQLEVGSNTYPQKLLLMTPTKGMVDGQLYQDALRSAWKVTGTKKVGGRTVFVMEPVKLSSKK
jgi:hypothetical protein